MEFHFQLATQERSSVLVWFIKLFEEDIGVLARGLAEEYECNFCEYVSEWIAGSFVDDRFSRFLSRVSSGQRLQNRALLGDCAKI